MSRTYTMTEVAHEARKQNARNSTGPCSSEAKNTVCQNAIQHGLCSKRIHVVEDLGETEKQLEEHMQRYREQFRPSGAVEQDIVAQIAVGYWKLQRIVYVEDLLVQNSQRTANDQTAENQARLVKELEGWIDLGRQLFPFVTTVDTCITDDIPPEDLLQLLHPIESFLKTADSYCVVPDDMDVRMVIRSFLADIRTCVRFPSSKGSREVLYKHASAFTTILEHLQVQLRKDKDELARHLEGLRLLALLPDKGLHQRLARYRREIERSLHSQLQLLKSLREIQGSVFPILPPLAIDSFAQSLDRTIPPQSPPLMCSTSSL